MSALPRYQTFHADGFYAGDPWSSCQRARAFRSDAAQVTSLGEQLAQAGQLAADATEDDKLRAAQKMVDDQIAQMEAQLKTVEAGQARESQQRFIGGTITAVVLAIAFALLAFTAVL